MTTLLDENAQKAIRVALIASNDSQDQAVVRRLRQHLRFSERSGLLAVWWPSAVEPSSMAEGSLFANGIALAEIVLVMVSPTLLSDPTTVSVLDGIEERSKAGTRIVPVLTRPTTLVFPNMGVRNNLTKTGHWIEKFSEVPWSGVHLVGCADPDGELTLIHREVRAIADRMNGERAKTE